MEKLRVLLFPEPWTRSTTYDREKWIEVIVEPHGR